MPRVKIDYVVSFSSEDPENQANNLLSWDVSKKKWLCIKGEPSCSVVLQLAKAVKISSVQIGVQHAALVEVLVGRSETPNDPYQVLVPSSVFLNPKESRSDTAIDRVRSFDGTALAPAGLARWDRVRLVCSQPYNKHCKYGVSFIHIFEPETGPALPVPPIASSTPVAPSSTAALLTSNAVGVPSRLLHLDAMSSDEDDFRPGELFTKHRQSAGADTGSQIRQATSQALKNNPTVATKLMKTTLSNNKPATARCSEPRDGPRDKNNLLYTHDDEQPHAKIDLVVQRHKDEKSKDKPIVKASEKTNAEIDKTPRSKELSTKDSDRNDNRKKRDESRRQDKDDKNDNRRNKDDNRKLNAERDKNDSKKQKDQVQQNNRNEASSSRTTNGRKRTHSDKNRTNNASTSSDSSVKAGPRSDRPLAGVILVLSGYENPRRARVRELALSLGARVHRDWGPDCTHLVCAFPNTPKLRTVRADRGPHVPVTRAEWIEECGRGARLLPWQLFATEDKDRRDYTPETNNHEQLSENDTDDEIEAVLRQKRARVSSPAPPSPHSPHGGRPSESEIQFVRDERFQGSKITIEDSDSSSGHDTDIEEPPQSASETLTSGEISSGAALPPLFAGLTFVLDAELVRPLDAQLLHRYCVAYGGLVLKPSEVDEESGEHYELCGSLAASRVVSPRTSRSRAVRVRGDWLWACHEHKALVPLTQYIM